MLAEVSGLIGELSAMEEAGVSSISVLYVLGRLRYSLVSSAGIPVEAQRSVSDSDTGRGRPDG